MNKINDNRNFYTLFIGCYNSDINTNIWKLKLNKDSGKIIYKKEYKTLDNPSWLYSEGNCLYVLEEIATDKNGNLIRYNLKSDKSNLKIEIEGKESCHFKKFNDHYVVSSYSGSSITYGNLKTGVKERITYSGNGPVKDRQKESHPHATQFSPCGKYFITADLGADSIYITNLDTLKSKSVKTEAGAGPRHMVFVENYLYVVNELNSTLSIYLWKDNNLLYIKSMSTRIEERENDNYPGGIIFNSNKNNLYISNRGDNTIITVNIKNREKPETIASFSSGGEWPRTIELTPDNKYLIVLNQFSGDVTLFPVSEEDYYKPTDSIKLTNPAGIAII